MFLSKNRRKHTVGDHRWPARDTHSDSTTTKTKSPLADQTVGAQSSSDVDNGYANYWEVKDNLMKACAICLEIMDQEVSPAIRQLDCEHEYHAKCVNTWLSNHNTCPICRQRVLSRGYKRSNAEKKDEMDGLADGLAELNVWSAGAYLSRRDDQTRLMRHYNRRQPCGPGMYYSHSQVRYCQDFFNYFWL